MNDTRQHKNSLSTLPHDSDGNHQRHRRHDCASAIHKKLPSKIASIGLRNLIALLLMVSAIVFGLVSFSYTDHPSEEVTDYCTLVIDQAVEKLKAFLKDYEDATFQFVANQDLNQLLSDYVSTHDPYETAPHNQTFSNFLEGYTFNRPGIYDAVFLDEANRDRKALTMRESFHAAQIRSCRDSNAYKTIIEADGKAVWVFEENYADTGENYVLVGRRIKHLFTGKPLGVLIILIEANELVRVINDYLHEHFYFSVGTVKTNCTVIVDGNGRIISMPPNENYLTSPLENAVSIHQLYSSTLTKRAEGSFTDVVNQENVFVVFRQIEGTDWRIFVPVSLAGLYSEDSHANFPGRLPIPLAGGLIAGALAATSLFTFFGPKLKTLAPQRTNSTQLEGHSAESTTRSTSPSSSDPDWLHDLNETETQILILLSQGYSNKEIAEKLCVAEQTVKNYVSALYSKLDVRNRVQASLLAIKAGLNRRDWQAPTKPSS